jgi:gliding motility associated protien GldN
MKKFIALLVAGCGLFLETNAQTALDGAYVPEHNPTRRVVPYPYLRQADVMWKKRIWQRVDLKQKMNYSLYYPTTPIKNRMCLYDVIIKGIKDGQITPYSTKNPFNPLLSDDEFSTPLSPEDALKEAANTETKTIFDENGEPLSTQDTSIAITAEMVKYFELKEDWIFDKQRSERYVRIIGIAPIVEKKFGGGTSVKDVPVFWLYFPECRYLFANADVFNLHNTSQPITFDDLFQKRMFSSYVVKEENVYDRRIEEYYKDPMKAILESERIKEDLFIFEHDLWHY